MKLLEVLLHLVSLMLCLSCSVKEDRDACPCRLVLDMNGVDTSVVRHAELVVSTSDGFSYRDTLGIDDFARDYIVDIPRGIVGVGAYFGADGCVAENGRLEIEYGQECPPVYMYSSLVEAYGEKVEEAVVLKKNHCLMTIHVQAEEGFPFRLSVRGTVNGYEPGGRPSEGEFMYSAGVDFDSVCQVAVPRQIDNSLRLEVSDGSDILKSFALGEYMHASGYDWHEPDLKDVMLNLDYSRTRISISVAGWNEEHVFDVII